jgi:WD40 repeat protein
MTPLCHWLLSGLAVAMASSPPGGPSTAPARLGTERFRHEGHALAASFSPDGKRLFSVASDGGARLWFVPGGEEVAAARFNLRTFGGIAVAWLPDGQVRVATRTVRTVRVWQPGARPLLHEFDAPALVTAVALSIDGRRLAAACLDTNIHLWDLDKGIEAGAVPCPREARAVAFAPDGKALAVAGEDGMLLVHGLAKPGQARRFVGHRGAVEWVRFTSDGRSLVSGGEDGFVRAWDAATGAERLRLEVAERPVSAALSPDGRTLAVAGTDEPLRVWDLTTGKESHPGRKLVAGRPLAISADGKLLASATAYAVRLWDLAAGKEMEAPPGHWRAVLSIAFAPDGKQVATADSADVLVWDAATGRLLRRMEGASIFPPPRIGFAAGGAVGVVPAPTPDTARSGDGATVANIISGLKVELADAATGKVLRQFPLAPGDGEEGPTVAGVALSADARWLAVLDAASRSVRVWEVASGKECGRFAAGREALAGVRLSPRGAVLCATRAVSRTIYFWDLLSGEELGRVNVWPHAHPAAGPPGSCSTQSRRAEDCAGPRRGALRRRGGTGQHPRGPRRLGGDAPTA